MMRVMRPMMAKGLMKPMMLLRLVGFVVLMGVMGCSDDRVEPAATPRATVEVSPYGHDFVEVTPASPGRADEIIGFGDADGFVSLGRADDGGEAGLTRAWPPTGYYSYSAMNGLFEGQRDLINSTIGVFFTKGASTQEYTSFFYQESLSKWNTTMELDGSTYHLYGFIPQEVADGAVLRAPATADGFAADAVEAGFADGGTLTLNGLSTVTASDPCVIVGAKEGSNASTDNGIQTGQFAVATQATSGGSGTNHIFLLFDHLYAALRFSFKLDAEYAKLRDINITGLRLQALADDGAGGVTGVGSKYNVTVKLGRTADGSTPIRDITYEPVGGSAATNEAIYAAGSTTGLRLSSTEFTHLRGCFAPTGITKFNLVTTYDVYDKQDNMTRKGCVATNRIDIGQLFESASSLERGRMFVVRLTVSPTYLYVLSEPDLDSPTVNIK